jgi:hypothetical protein
VAIRMASATMVATAPGSTVSPMVGAPAVVASAARIAVRDDLPVTTGAVATMRGSTGCSLSTVGLVVSFARVRLRPMSALRLVASLSRFLMGGT